MDNTGIIIESRHEGDYVYGSPKAAPVVRTVFDWSPFLPVPELQYGFQDCTTFSGDHAIETQINRDIQQGKYKQEALDYFESAGYMDNGRFRISERYSAKMNGTTTEGQYMSVAGDGFHNHGLLPHKDWPLAKGMTWNEYYAPVPKELQDKAKNIYGYLEVFYSWVNLGDMDNALLNGPVQVAIGLCQGYSDPAPVPMCGNPCQHCVLVYGKDADGDYLVLDQLDPCFKKLSPDYHIFAAMQYVVRPALPPSLWSKLLSLISAKKI